MVNNYVNNYVNNFNNWGITDSTTELTAKKSTESDHALHTWFSVRN